MRQLFLRCSDTVVEALADPDVQAAWHQPSSLEEQTVGMLAAHVARSVVSAAGYLGASPPDRDGVDLDSTAAYLAMAHRLDPDAHVGVRLRSAALAAAGPVAVHDEVVATLRALVPLLDAAPADHRLAVFAGKVMRLDDYLGTRVIEQVVHLDDLARSLGREPWEVPERATRFVVDTALDAGVLAHGSTAMMRALYRGDTDGVIPVL